MTPNDRTAPASEPLTPLVRQLASQLRASRTGSAVAKSFPEREGAVPSSLKDTLDRIRVAAEQSKGRQDTIERLKARLDEVESKLATQAAHLLDTESALRSAQDDTRRERARADEFERRSEELLNKTQAMLSDAGDRLNQAESRAEAAEADLSFLKEFVQERLGG